MTDRSDRRTPRSAPLAILATVGVAIVTTVPAWAQQVQPEQDAGIGPEVAFAVGVVVGALGMYALIQYRRNNRQRTVGPAGGVAPGHPGEPGGQARGESGHRHAAGGPQGTPQDGVPNGARPAGAPRAADPQDAPPASGQQGPPPADNRYGSPERGQRGPPQTDEHRRSEDGGDGKR